MATFKEKLQEGHKKIKDWMERHRAIVTIGELALFSGTMIGIGYYCGNEHGKRNPELNSEMVHDYIYYRLTDADVVLPDGEKRENFTLHLMHDDGSLSTFEK